MSVAPTDVRPRRIAMLSMHTSPLAPLGGRETGGMNVYVREVARCLSDLGIAVDVYTRRTSADALTIQPIAERARVIEVEAGPLAPVEKEEMAPLTAAFAQGVLAVAAAETLRYDLVYSHYWLSADAGESIARAWGVPHAAMFHTLAEVKLRARASEHERVERLEAERRLVHAVDRIVAATEHERQLLRQIYRVPPQQVAVIPLGVDLDVFVPRPLAEARARVGLAAEDRVILAVGRIEPLKGLDILIRAVAQLSDRSTVRLVIIGGDSRATAEIDRLRTISVEVGVADRVSFVGARPHAELPDWYAAADVVAVPSFYESFGLVAVEAMACGTPVVASRVGGLASTVVDGRTGYLVPWRCPEPFAEKFELLFHNEPLRRNLGAAGVARMRGYGWPAVADRVAREAAALAAERAASVQAG